MNTFIFDFDGYWPVGVSIAVIAPDAEAAERIAKSRLTAEGHDPDTVKLRIELDSSAVQSFVIADGNY